MNMQWACVSTASPVNLAHAQRFVWGSGERGRLGRNSEANYAVPTHLSGEGAGWSTLSAGAEHSAANAGVTGTKNALRPCTARLPTYPQAIPS